LNGWVDIYDMVYMSWSFIDFVVFAIKH